MHSVSMSRETRKQAKISEWFSLYGKRLYGFVKSKIANLEEAEDISQEVWFQLSRLEDVNEIEEIGNWLFHVAKNRILNFYKKKKSIPFSSLEGSLKGAELPIEEDSTNLYFDLWAEENLPSDILEAKEFWEIMEIILSKLPPEQRDVFVENELNDKSFREMAEETGISINTLLARKTYAVKKIRTELLKILNN